MRNVMFIIVILSFSTLKSQVSIGHNTPKESSILDIGSTNKGILIPRVSIDDLTTKAPITTTTIEESLLVYNTNTSTGKGFYYWDGSKWHPIFSSPTSTTSTNLGWSLAGNNNTGNAFLGTIDSNPLEIRTGNTQRLHLDISYNLKGGYQSIIAGSQNFAYGNQVQVSGQNNTSFGNLNIVSGSYNLVSGQQNAVSSTSSNISGVNNYIEGDMNLVSGEANRITKESSYGATIGRSNTISSYNAIAIGESNTVEKQHGYTMGYNNKVIHEYAMALGNQATTEANSQMVAHFNGGYKFYTGTSIAAVLTPGSGSWSNVSDRSMKENFISIDKHAILEKINSIEISKWNYKSQEDSIKHIGPMAQDFYKEFQLGSDEKMITSSDIDGINMAAIQALSEKIILLENKIKALENNK